MSEPSIFALGLQPDEGGDSLHLDEQEAADFLARIVSEISWADNHYRERNLEFIRQARWFFKDHYERSSPTQTTDTLFRGGDPTSNQENEHVVTLNFPFSSVQRAHSMLTGEQPIIETVARETENARKTLKMLYATFDANARRWGSHPMYDAIFNQLLYGWGVVRTTWVQGDSLDVDDGFKGDLPRYSFPIEVKSIEPDEVYPIPGGVNERWKAIIHQSYMPVYEVEEQYGVTLHMCESDRPSDWDYEKNGVFNFSMPLDPNMDVRVIDYWCWHRGAIYHCVVAHEQFVLAPTKLKFYDSLPFTIFHCASTTSKDGSRMGLGINYALVDTVAEMEYITNRQVEILNKAATQKLVTVRDSDTPIDTSGEVIEISVGENVYYLQMSVPNDLGQLQRFFMEILNTEGFATIDRGESGVDTLAQTQSNLIKIFKPKENAQAAWEDVNSKIIGLFQRFSWSKSLPFFGIIESDDSSQSFTVSLKGEDTKGYRDTRVTLRARFPLEELRNMASAATAKNAELVPDTVIQRKWLGAHNPKNWQKELQRQRLENSPDAIAFLVQNNLQAIVNHSTVMAQAKAELEKVGNGLPNEERGLPGAQGGPETGAAPTDGPSPEEVQQMMMAPGGATGQVDNPAPINNAATPSPVGLDANALNEMLRGISG